MLRKSYEVDVPNKLVPVPEPGILFTRDNARWAYYALKDAREAGRSIPEQDELCDELAALLFPAAKPEPDVHAADCGLQGGGLDKHCTCPAGRFEPGELIEYVSNLGALHGRKRRQWSPGTFAAYPDSLTSGAMLIWALRKANGRLLRYPGEVRRIPAETVSAARSWLAENQWQNLDSEDIADLTDFQVVAGVQRYCDGGWNAFRAAEGA